MNDFLQNITLHQSAGVLLVVALVMRVVLSMVLTGLVKQAQKTKNQLDNHLIEAVALPLKTMIWFGLVFFLIDLFKGELEFFLSLIAYINIVPIFIVAWAVIRMVSGIEAYLIKRKSKVNSDSVRLISRLAKILIGIGIALGLAQYLGFSVSGLLTFGGVGGIVIGFAAKDMLSNIFGGLMLQMDRPFSTGDWIRSDQFEGTVENIGWRMTRIRTFSKNPIYIPNSIFSSIPIETPSRMTNRRIKETIGIRYDDIAQMPIIVAEIESMLTAHKEIDQTQPLRVYFNYFNASSLDINVYAFSKTTEKDKYQQLKQQILLEIANIIARHKAEIAYPTQTINIHK
ncbi:MAG: mechanosensitive ion channel family protein [Gammaproteobacteria bacterium]|nr:MAG: mechanosensitive ion channel family protein [Gammaproteobacteria bacterium]